MSLNSPNQMKWTNALRDMNYLPHKLPKLTYKEIDKINSPLPIKEIQFVV